MRRPLAIAVAVGAIAIAAVLSFEAIRSELPGPTPSASPPVSVSPTLAATVTPTATASASPSPTVAVATDRYAYVFANNAENEERIVVRRESDAASVFELAGVSPAVSPDGKRLAYWRLTANVGATDLRVLEVADPSSDRAVYTVPSDSLGGSMVWSNDGQGLLIGLYSREPVGGGGVEGGNPARSDVLMLDLASTPAATRTAATPLSGGSVYLPVAWDRPGKAAAAVVTGPGGYATDWTTWNGNAATAFDRVPVPPPSIFAESVQASADAKLVMGLEDSLNVLRVWPTLDITAAGQVRHPSRVSPFPLWRPGPTGPYEVIWVVGQNVDLFRYRTDSSGTLFTSTEHPVLVAVRPDGSGVLVSTRPSSPALPPPTRLLVIDIATRQTAEVTVLAIPLGGNVRVVSRGVLLR